MQLENLFTVVDCHTAGEPARIVTAGCPSVRGHTMAEKARYFAKHFDYVRTALMQEPRGHKGMFGAVLVPPTVETANLGAIFMDPSGYLHMCGHATIAIGTVAVETGLFPLSRTAPIILETPAGLVSMQVEASKGRVKSVTFCNVPSFFYSDVELEVSGIGRVPAAIAFGGNFFLLVEDRYLGVSLGSTPTKQLIDLGMTVLELARKQVAVQHPIEPHINSIDLIEFHCRSDRAEPYFRNLTIWGEGQFDRSPCGSGTSALMATLYAKGELSAGQQLITEGIARTKFCGRVVAETTVGGFRGIVPEITGSAFIIGLNQWVVDAQDPLKYGFLAS